VVAVVRVAPAHALSNTCHGESAYKNDAS
jgi:hypothetical protein